MNTQNNVAVKKKNVIYVMIFSAIVGFAAQVVSYSQFYIFYYRDAVYRLEKAREFSDSTYSGFLNHLGTVWLPVTHILMAPFAAIDNLWYTGNAGSIIGYACFILNVVFIYLILKVYIENKFAIIIGVLVYALNPNLLYFQTSALTEQPYLLFMTASVYFLMKYSSVEKKSFLLYAGLFVTLAMGTRYDGWAMFFVSFALLFIAVSGFKNKIKPSVIFSVIPVSFLIFWFFYNWSFYGDPLEFSRGKYSTLQQLIYYEKAGRLLTKFSWSNSFNVAYHDVLAYIGPVLLGLTLLGVVIYSFRIKFTLKSLLPYLLLVPYLMIFLLLYLGQIIIELPDSNPPGFFNSRYAICVLPATAFFVSYFIYSLITNSTVIKRIILFASIILICWQQYYYYSSYPDNIPALAEAKYCFDPTTRNYTYFLKENYDGGKVFYDFAVFALSPETKINIRDRFTYYTPDKGRESLKDPKPYAKWVLYYDKSGNDSVYLNLKDNKVFHEEYNNVFSDGGVNIFKLK